jgi:molecular chaperone DnaK (HSP70)
VVPSRFLIGIDLGTTNSVVAYIDTRATLGANSPIAVFSIPQLVAPGEIASLPTLPSFLYFPTDEELSGGGVVATWDEQPPMVTGVLAREQGALVPSRQVSSAKSWLSYPGVHRRAKILPAQAEPPQPVISPVEASARYLMHMRDAWNRAFAAEAGARFEHQEIVLTVPGSFDEEARELTVEAARMAKLENLILLEEPLAAFYAWIAANPAALTGHTGELRDGELILICDIGGGTSDFSLIRARLVNSKVQFERTAIGEHLLLGGDNLDLALARYVETKLPGSKLTMRQRYALRRACCAAKELLLSDPSVDHVPVTILGTGRTVVGKALTADLTRDELLQILTTGFLPITAPDDMPSAARPTALRELGLVYASDPAITRHLAAFLKQAALAMNSSFANMPLARPDAVLFNGGFCTPAVARDRIVDAISAWFGASQSGWRPRLLHNESLDTAVARGAAYYGRVRRGAGLRIRAGCARTYYIGLPSSDGLEGVCILPAGAEEGTTLPLPNREFSVLANRPVSFALYSSRTRHDAHGEVAALAESDVHRHPPLVTLLRYGKKMRDLYLTIGLRATFTEVGTLELWCESRQSPHRWRLQFELREQEAAADELEEAKAQLAQPPRRHIPPEAADADIESAEQMIRRAFGASTNSAAEASLAPEALIPDIEQALAIKRDSWSISVTRHLTDALIDCTAARKMSPAHEMRWLNLSGFCSRPGFGAPDDAARVNKLRAFAANLAFPEDLQSQIAALVLLRRIAGGINASEQQALYRKHAAPGAAKKKRLNRQLEYEQWRLLASLEQLLAGARALMGNELLGKIKKDPGDAMWLWSLGRLGARIPLYGPLHCVVTPEIAGEWLQILLDLPTFTSVTASAIIAIARRTGDPSRDLDDAIRTQAISRLASFGIAEDSIQLLSKYVPPERSDAVRSFGESLPPGLQLVSSGNCLLSLPAFRSLGV